MHRLLDLFEDAHWSGAPRSLGFDERRRAETGHQRQGCLATGATRCDQVGRPVNLSVMSDHP